VSPRECRYDVRVGVAQVRATTPQAREPVPLVSFGGSVEWVGRGCCVREQMRTLDIASKEQEPWDRDSMGSYPSLRDLMRLREPSEPMRHGKEVKLRRAKALRRRGQWPSLAFALGAGVFGCGGPPASEIVFSGDTAARGARIFVDGVEIGVLEREFFSGSDSMMFGIGFRHGIAVGERRVLALLPSGDSLVSTFQPSSSGSVTVIGAERRIMAK
jgi:hypothetical protein